MDDHGVSIQQPRIQGVLGDQGGIGHNGGIPHILHAPEVGLGHADGPVGVARVFIALSPANPAHRFLEDRHGDPGTFHRPRRHQVFQAHRPPGVIADFVHQRIPRAHTDQKKIRRHRHRVVVGDDLS